MMDVSIENSIKVLIKSNARKYHTLNVPKIAADIFDITRIEELEKYFK